MLPPSGLVYRGPWRGPYRAVQAHDGVDLYRVWDARTRWFVVDRGGGVVYHRAYAEADADAVRRARALGHAIEVRARLPDPGAAELVAFVMSRDALGWDGAPSNVQVDVGRLRPYRARHPVAPDLVALTLEERTAKETGDVADVRFVACDDQGRNPGAFRMHVRGGTKALFDRYYEPLPKAQLAEVGEKLWACAQELGASDHVWAVLRQLLNKPGGVPDMTAQGGSLFAGVETGAATTTAPSKKADKPKANGKAKEVKAKPAAAKKPEPKKATAKPAKEAKPKAEAKPRESASTLFQELIMAGAKTDDAIFAEVQKRYGLADDKRSYVGWYRSKLRRDGIKNVPDAKVAKGAKK